MNRLPMLFLTLSLLPSAMAAGGGYDCPPHPAHCKMDPLQLLDDITLSATARVEASASATTTGTIGVVIGASAEVIVELTLTTNSTPRSVNATVIVDETAGIEFTGPTTRATALDVGDTAVLRFPFTSASDLEPGDVIFIPVSMSAEGLTSSGLTAFQAKESWMGRLGGPIAAALAGLGSGVGVTWYALRRE